MMMAEVKLGSRHGGQKLPAVCAIASITSPGSNSSSESASDAQSPPSYAVSSVGGEAVHVTPLEATSPISPPAIGQTPAYSPSTGPPLGRVAIPRATNMTAMKTGPMSSDIVIPARPKPGRKPLKAGDPNDRRRAQNRTAQRKHRDRRQERFDDAVKQLEDAKEAIQGREAAYWEERERNTRQIADLEAKLQVANERIRELENVARSQHTPPKKEAPAVTNKRKSVASPETVHNYPPPVDFTTYSTVVDQEMQDDNFSCGFCTDSSNCQCRPAKVAKATITKAGTCAACRTDPARAAACRQLAATATSDPTSADPSGLIAEEGTTLPPILPTGSTISCSEFLDRARQVAPLESVRQLFGNQLHARRSVAGGYELDEHEAAQGIALLSNSRSR